MTKTIFINYVAKQELIKKEFCLCADSIRYTAFIHEKSLVSSIDLSYIFRYIPTLNIFTIFLWFHRIYVLTLYCLVTIRFSNKIHMWNLYGFFLSFQFLAKWCNICYFFDSTFSDVPHVCVQIFEIYSVTLWLRVCRKSIRIP